MLFGKASFTVRAMKERPDIAGSLFRSLSYLCVPASFLPKTEGKRCASGFLNSGFFHCETCF